MVFTVNSVLNSTWTALEDAAEFVYINYVDIYYLQWLIWVFYPLVLTFLLPLFMMLFLYVSALFLHLYRVRRLLREAYTRPFWDGAVQFLCLVWEAQAKIWHGYEAIGLENIPATGPCLLIFYHGALPLDFYYMIATLELHKHRRMYSVGDRFLFKIPGLKLLMEVVGVAPGTVSACVDTLKQDKLLAIAPGGVREAYFSDENYSITWEKRIGFAKIAIEAKVPIVPVFTQNCREAFRALSTGRSIFRRLYEKTRLPIVPIYGGFPVKLRTFIGNQIPYDPNLSPEELSKRVQKAVQDLISKHQVKPGSIFRALLERFYTPAHCKQS